MCVWALAHCHWTRALASHVLAVHTLEMPMPSTFADVISRRCEWKLDFQWTWLQLFSVKFTSDQKGESKRLAYAIWKAVICRGRQQNTTIFNKHTHSASHICISLACVHWKMLQLLEEAASKSKMVKRSWNCKFNILIWEGNPYN